MAPASSPCHILTQQELNTAFGAPVTVSLPDTYGCTMMSGGIFMIVSLFSTFTVQSQAAESTGSKIVTISGHPATITGDGNVVVAFGHSVTAPGVVKFYTSTTQEQEIAKKLVPKFLARCSADGSCR